MRAELNRILASDLFIRSERLSAFLKFIVERTLDGQGDSLKEQVIAVEVFAKGTDFDTAADPVVRVDARRLRDKLREHYATAPRSGIVISVPKGTYTPVFLVDSGESGQPAESLPPKPVSGSASASTVERPAHRWWVAAAAIALVAAGSSGMIFLRNGDRRGPTRLLTVTSMPGSEEDPSLSPDGNFVAFSWADRSVPDAPDDIWIKAVDGDALRQLTHTPDVEEKFPRWSPDGRTIAFTRRSGGRQEIFIVSALGGVEQKIDEGLDATWSADGRSLVFRSLTPNQRFGIVQHVLETGERRPLTDPPQAFVDAHPRVSPDGGMLAFQRSGEGRSAVLVVPMSGGEPRVLGGWSSGLIGGAEWTVDGQEILFSRPEVSGRRLVRIAVSGRADAVPVAGVPYEAVNPSISRVAGRNAFRLAISSGQREIGLRLVDLQPHREDGAVVTDSPFYDSTRVDIPGRFSPDGTQVAFVSDRSGHPQLWIGNRDGSALRSVTQLQDATVNVGSWSPDSKSVTFDATVNGSTHIYVVAATGGPIRRLTDAASTEIDAEWSRDGRSIYFASNESGGWAIWKTPAGGGARTRLTSEPGYELRESPDGHSIYFIDRPRVYFGLGSAIALKRISADDGQSESVGVSVVPGAWDITDGGVVFVGPRDNSPEATSPPDTLQIFSVRERRTRFLGTLAFRVGFGVNHFLTASRDGRWAIISHVDRWDRDVFVVDNFR